MVKHEKPLNNENETITVTAEVAIDQNVQDEAVQPNGDEEKIEKDVEDKENCQNEPEEVMVPEEVILPEEVIVPQEEIPPNDVSIDSPVNLLSDVEKEKQLQLKYQVMKKKSIKFFYFLYLSGKIFQVTPCSVKLTRYVEQNEEADANTDDGGAAAVDVSMVPIEHGVSQEIVAPIKCATIRGRSRKRRFTQSPTAPIVTKDVPVKMVQHETAQNELTPDEMTKTETTTTRKTVQNDEISQETDVPAVKESTAGATISNEASTNQTIPKQSAQIETVTALSPRKSKVGRKSYESPKKANQEKAEKSVRKKTPQEVCFLCGQKFQSSFALTHHMNQEHAQSSNDSPVFPCNVCGKNVSNLKLHLRQHNAEKAIYAKVKAKKTPRASKNGIAPAIVQPAELNTTNDTNSVAIPNDTTVAAKNDTPAVVPNDTNSVAVSNNTEPVVVPNNTDPVAVPNNTDPVAVPNDTDPVAVPNNTDPVSVPNDTTSAEITSSTDAIVTATASEKEPENGITSNETINELIETSLEYHLSNELPFDSSSFHDPSEYGLPDPTILPPLNLLDEYPIVFDELSINNTVSTHSTQHAVVSNPAVAMAQYPMAQTQYAVARTQFAMAPPQYVMASPHYSVAPNQYTMAPAPFTVALVVDNPPNGFPCNNGVVGGDIGVEISDANGHPNASIESTDAPVGNGGKKEKVKKNKKMKCKKRSTQMEGVFGCIKCKRRFHTQCTANAHMAKHDQKINCKHCGKQVARSYKYFHMKRYGCGSKSFSAVEEQVA